MGDWIAFFLEILFPPLSPLRLLENGFLNQFGLFWTILSVLTIPLGVRLHDVDIAGAVLQVLNAPARFQ